MEVNVGQIVFVLNAKTHSLVPAQIDEVVVSRKLEGETTQHILILQNRKKVALENLQTPWFTELSKAKSYLLSEAEKMIDEVINQAGSAAAEHFSTPRDTGLQAPAETAPELLQLGAENPSNFTVDIGDGRKARVTLPEELSFESPSS